MELAERLSWPGESASSFRSRAAEGGADMKLAKRIAVAISSLVALVLAGGAHIKF